MVNDQMSMLTILCILMMHCLSIAWRGVVEMTALALFPPREAVNTPRIASRVVVVDDGVGRVGV